MTSPGYPDFQSYPQWRAVPLAAGNVSTSIVSPYTKQGYVTNWQSFSISAVLNSTGGITISLTYYTDASQVVQVGFFAWTLAATGTRLNVTVPNLANFVVLQVTTVEAGTKLFSIAAGAVNVPVARAEYQVSNNVAGNSVFLIGAGSSAQFILPDVVAGDGYFMVEQTAGVTGFNVLIQTLQENGAISGPIAERLNATGAISGTFIVSEQTTQINVTNLDAAARNFDIYVTVIGR